MVCGGDRDCQIEKNQFILLTGAIQETDAIEIYVNIHTYLKAKHTEFLYGAEFNFFLS